MSSPSKRKVSHESLNLNHLLNFSLPPRQSHFSSGHGPAVSRRSYRKTGNQGGIWNKERFVNAQYRFIMNPAGDYTVHFADPDIFFQWHDILQVIIPRLEGTGHTTCPICLSPPTAPRMTKCGHVFCYPCILHYLHTSENKWARCPICFDSVNERQLKNVKWFDGLQSTLTPLASGTLLPMRLIQRPAGTTLALPRSSTYPSSLFPTSLPTLPSASSPFSNSAPGSSGLLPTPFHFLPDVYTFSRFMLATPSQLVSDLSNDLADLEVEKRVLGGMHDEIGITFVEGAMRRVRGLISRVQGEGDVGNVETSYPWGIGSNLKERIEKARQELRTVENRAQQERQWAEKVRKAEEEREKIAEVEDEVPEEFLAIKAGGSISKSISTSSTSSATHSIPPPSQSKPKQSPSSGSSAPQMYYYYQAASGLPIYLHPLDIKILSTHFGNNTSSTEVDTRQSAPHDGAVGGAKRNRRGPRAPSSNPSSTSTTSNNGGLDYSSLPNTILVKVDAFSEGTVDEDLRKRCKYLSHLPEGADVCFVEVEWEAASQSRSHSHSDPQHQSSSQSQSSTLDQFLTGAQESTLTMIPPSSLRPFSHALSIRKSRRREKGRKDERARVRAEEREWEREWERTRLNRLGPVGPPNFTRGDGGPTQSTGVNGMNGSIDSGVVDPDSEPERGPAPELDHAETERPPSPPVPSSQDQRQPVSGVWGSRSFASAAQSHSQSPTFTPTRRNRPQTEREREDEWEIDIAWHELEERHHANVNKNDRGGGGGTGSGGGTGKKNKGNGGRSKNTLVVLGGGGGRRR